MNPRISLQSIRDHHPCRDGWTTLLKSLDNPSDLSTTVTLGDIALSNGALDAWWCVRCLDLTDITLRRKVISTLLPAVKRSSVHTKDQRVHDCITAIQKWIDGDDSVDLEAQARASASASASSDAAWEAAWASEAASASSSAELAVQVTDLVTNFPPTHGK